MQQHLRSDEVDSAYEAHATKPVYSPCREQAFSKNVHLLVAHASADAYADTAHQILEHVPTEEYYYDTHPLLEDVVMEGSPHYDLLHYLMEVLRWLYHEQVCVLHGNLGIYPSRDSQQSALVPDLSVFKGMVYEPLSSWKLGQTGPAPQVVFEIASGGTWEKDVEEKPQLYAQMRVKEYFLYDPADPPVMKDMPRLLGWKRNSDGEMEALVRHEADWLWSQQLESYLGADGQWLRLYDNRGQQRLTKAEALEQDNDALAEENDALMQDNDALEQRAHTLAQEKLLAEQRAQASEQRAQTLAQEKQRVEHEKRLAEQEKRMLAQEKQQVEQDLLLAEQHAQTLAQDKLLAEQHAHTLAQDKRLAEQRAHALAEQLRALGINPDDLA